MKCHSTSVQCLILNDFLFSVRCEKQLYRSWALNETVFLTIEIWKHVYSKLFICTWLAFAECWQLSTINIKPNVIPDTRLTQRNHTDSKDHRTDFDKTSWSVQRNRIWSMCDRGRSEGLCYLDKQMQISCENTDCDLVANTVCFMNANLIKANCVRNHITVGIFT